MALYFLHVRDRDELIEDEEGQEFASIVEARAAAVLSAREIMSARIIAGKAPDHSTIEIVDTLGKTMLVVPFLETIAAHDPIA